MQYFMIQEGSSFSTHSSMYRREKTIALRSKQFSSPFFNSIQTIKDQIGKNTEDLSTIWLKT